MMKHLFLLLFVIVSFSCNSTSSTTDNDTHKLEFKALITHVSDGDTAKMLYHDLTITLRFEHIDAPETRGGQAYGKKAKQTLKNWIDGKKVTVRTNGKFDGYGRLIVTLYLNGQNINKRMVEKGMAWHYSKYSEDSSYAKAQQEAQNTHRGLWHDKHPTPPWEFRRR